MTRMQQSECLLDRRISLRQTMKTDDDDDEMMIIMATCNCASAELRVGVLTRRLRSTHTYCTHTGVAFVLHYPVVL